MRRGRIRHLKSVLVLLAFATCSFAQAPQPGSNQPPPQTAPPPAAGTAEFPRPGALNYVQGQVSANGEPLTPQAVGRFSLQPGQTLETANGYAEVLLTPGAFLRVGPNTQFRMTSVGLADTRMALIQGNAMVEIDQIIEGTHLEVTIGSTSADMLKKGLYEFTANPPNVRVFAGKADLIGLTTHREIGGGDEILLANNPKLKKTSFDKKQAQLEPLYVWSEARSRAEAAQNQLVAQNSNGYVPVGDGWFWDPYADYYGFWPPGYFYSPFGFGFYGGFYPGFYGGFYAPYHHGFFGWHRGGASGFHGVHGNGVHGFGGSFHGGGFHGGGFHGGGHR